jgi:hypothetical protein
MHNNINIVRCLDYIYIEMRIYEDNISALKKKKNPSIFYCGVKHFALWIMTSFPFNTQNKWPLQGKMNSFGKFIWYYEINCAYNDLLIFFIVK